MEKISLINKIADSKTSYYYYKDGGLKLVREKLQDSKWVKTHEFKLQPFEVRQINIIYSKNQELCEDKWNLKILLKKLRNLLVRET